MSGLTGANSPFAAMSKGVSLSQSIAFTVVYALMGAALILRTVRGVTHKVAYICFTIFAVFRVVTFILRAVMSQTKPTSKHFLGVLMASGIVMVGGFLLLVEAVFFLNIDWHYAIRGRDRDARRRNFMKICHAIVVILTMLGIVGAVLMLTSLTKNPPDMKQFQVSKDLRIASGSLFLVFCVGVMVLPIVISLQTPHHSRIRRFPITVLLVVFGAALVLECIYRIYSAVKTDGFVMTQAGLDVFLVLPEWLILFPSIILHFDSMGEMGFWKGQRGGPVAAVDRAGEAGFSGVETRDSSKTG